MCEWFIKCHHCLEWNIPSTEYHALDMIGPWHEDISEENAGVICHRCTKPLRPRTGEWVPRHPDRMGYNEGYHVPQILVPVHYKHPQKWRIIAGAKNGSMPVNVFHNEILGESYDVGAKLVTETDLRNACVLGFPNTPTAPAVHVLQRRDRYERTALGIDWGGGGESGTSFTAAAFCGVRSDNKIDVLWAKRLMTPNDDAKEAADIIKLHQTLEPYLLAHDFNGAGSVHETLLLQMGLERARLVPMSYVRASASEMVKFVPGDAFSRPHYRLDKVRTLLTVIQAMKFGYLRFFDYDRVDSDNPGVVGDFLSLVEEKMPTASGGDVYTIRKSRSGTDDFAHAVNFAATALWHSMGKFPNFGDVMKSRGIVSHASLGMHGGEAQWAEGDY